MTHRRTFITNFDSSRIMVPCVKKGTRIPPKRSSEEAWSNKHYKRKSFLEEVRSMRYYCTDSRSYLLLRIFPRQFKNGIFSDATYARWPRHIP